MYDKRYRRFERQNTRGKISGVCAWMADRMDWDVTVVRLVTLVGFFIAPVFSLIGYFATALIMPKLER